MQYKNHDHNKTQYKHGEYKENRINYENNIITVRKAQYLALLHKIKEMKHEITLIKRHCSGCR